MAAEPKQKLEYDRTTTTVSVRGFRLLVLLTLLNTAMLGWFTVTGSQGPQFVRDRWREWKANREVQKVRAQLLADQAQCLSHAFPEDTVAYTEDPTRIAALDRPGGAYRRIAAGNVTVPDWSAPLTLAAPAHWKAFGNPAPVSHGYDPVSDVPSVAFLHERSTPGGERRLVVAHVLAWQRFDRGGGTTDVVTPLRCIDVRVYSPFAAGKPAKLTTKVDLHVQLPAPNALRVTRAADGSRAVRPLHSSPAGPTPPTRLTSRFPTKSTAARA